MTAKCSPLITPISNWFRSPYRPMSTAAVEILRDPEVRREQIRGSGRNDCDRGSEPAEHVDASLHHAVATPDEHEIGTVGQCPTDPLGRLLRLVDLEPHRVRHARHVQDRTELGQAASERLFPSVQSLQRRSCHRSYREAQLLKRCRVSLRERSSTHNSAPAAATEDG